jgi:hypothetical protein
MRRRTRHPSRVLLETGAISTASPGWESSSNCDMPIGVAHLIRWTSGSSPGATTKASQRLEEHRTELNRLSNNHFWDRTCRKVNLDRRPSSNRRRHRYTAPPSGICGGSLLASCPRARAGAPFDDDLSLPGLKQGRPSRRDVAFGPLGWLGQLVVRLRKNPPRLRGERT